MSHADFFEMLESASDAEQVEPRAEQQDAEQDEPSAEQRAKIAAAQKRFADIASDQASSQHKRSTIFDFFNTLSGLLICQICTIGYSDQAPVMINKCGHTLCSECADKSEVCPFCRCKVEGRINNWQLLELRTAMANLEQSSAQLDPEDWQRWLEERQVQRSREAEQHAKRQLLLKIRLFKECHGSFMWPEFNMQSDAAFMQQCLDQAMKERREQVRAVELKQAKLWEAFKAMPEDAKQHLRELGLEEPWMRCSISNDETKIWSVMAPEDAHYNCKRELAVYDLPWQTAANFARRGLFISTVTLSSGKKTTWISIFDFQDPREFWLPQTHSAMLFVYGSNGSQNLSFNMQPSDAMKIMQFAGLRREIEMEVEMLKHLLLNESNALARAARVAQQERNIADLQRLPELELAYKDQFAAIHPVFTRTYDTLPQFSMRLAQNPVVTMRKIIYALDPSELWIGIANQPDLNGSDWLIVATKNSFRWINIRSNASNTMNYVNFDDTWLRGPDSRFMHQGEFWLRFDDYWLVAGKGTGDYRKETERPFESRPCPFSLGCMVAGDLASHSCTSMVFAPTPSNECMDWDAWTLGNCGDIWTVKRNISNSFMLECRSILPGA